MTRPDDQAAERQRAYYTATAAHYDSAHLSSHGEHDHALELIAGLLRPLGARRIVDIGAGTGRGVLRLQELLPDCEVFGIEPVEALVAAGREKGLDESALRVGDGLALPLDTGSVDVAIATGVLHHVPTPALVLREMMRVSSMAVFVSDSNRFGQGRFPARIAKLGLYSLGLWKAFDFVRTRGRGYMESAGDGIFYSYSVFDDLPELSAWASRTLVAPLDPDATLRGTWLSRLGPILTSSHILIGAFR